MKLTKRKGFNFFRSYYDVYNELEDKDKVAFMDALLDRQFLGVKPTGLEGMAKFAYISQTNSIDGQVKGYEDKTGDILTPCGGGTAPPCGGGNNPPSLQVKEKEEVEEEVEEKEKVNILMSKANASDLSKVNGSYFEISKAFYDLLIENSKKLNVRWIHLEKISAEKFTNDIRLMCEQDGRTKEDLKAVWAFLKVDDFWMQNIQSSKKIREKFDQLITKSKNGTRKKKFSSFAAEQLATDQDYKNL